MYLLANTSIAERHEKTGFWWWKYRPRMTVLKIWFLEQLPMRLTNWGTLAVVVKSHGVPQLCKIPVWFMLFCIHAFVYWNWTVGACWMLQHPRRYLSECTMGSDSALVRSRDWIFLWIAWFSFNMYIYIYVCMYISIYVCIYIYTHIYIYIWSSCSQPYGWKSWTLVSTCCRTFQLQISKNVMALRTGSKKLHDSPVPCWWANS